MDGRGKPRDGHGEHVCGTCWKAFPSIGQLRSHQWTLHGEKDLTCDVCGMEFRSGDSRRKHRVRKHPEATSAQAAEIVCGIPQCVHKSSYINDLCQHLQTTHGIEAKVEKLEFESYGAFVTWKNSTEADLVSNFRRTVVKEVCFRLKLSI